MNADKEQQVKIHSHLHFLILDNPRQACFSIATFGNSGDPGNTPRPKSFISGS